MEIKEVVVAMPATCPACLGAIDLTDEALFLTGCPHCGMVLPRGRDRWVALATAGENARLRVALDALLDVAERDRAGYAVAAEVWYAARDTARAALGR